MIVVDFILLANEKWNHDSKIDVYEFFGKFSRELKEKNWKAIEMSSESFENDCVKKLDSKLTRSKNYDSTDCVLDYDSTLNSCVLDESTIKMSQNSESAKIDGNESNSNYGNNDESTATCFNNIILDSQTIADETGYLTDESDLNERNWIRAQEMHSEEVENKMTFEEFMEESKIVAGNFAIAGLKSTMIEKEIVIEKENTNEIEEMTENDWLEVVLFCSKFWFLFFLGHRTEMEDQIVGKNKTELQTGLTNRTLEKCKRRNEVSEQSELIQLSKLVQMVSNDLLRSRFCILLRFFSCCPLILV